jgi:hypothetical protein
VINVRILFNWPTHGFLFEVLGKATLNTMVFKSAQQMIYQCWRIGNGQQAKRFVLRWCVE